MKEAQNVQFIGRFFETQVNRDDLSVYEEFFFENVIIHGPSSNQKIRGLAETRKIDTSYSQIYPGKQFTIEEIFGYSDRVIVRWVCRGKHKGKYKGISPNG
jgi:predicted ester cyclase